MKLCPRDKDPLQHPKGVEPIYLHCGKCRGLWLPADVVLSLIGKVKRSGEPERLIHATGMSCPDDGGSLVALHRGDIEIDVCSNCRGVWLDVGEIEQLAIKRGGYTTADVVGGVVDGMTDPALLETLGALGELTSDAIDLIVEIVGGALEAL